MTVVGALLGSVTGGVIVAMLAGSSGMVRIFH
jgi:hypothetical protein